MRKRINIFSLVSFLVRRYSLSFCLILLWAAGMFFSPAAAASLKEETDINPDAVFQEARRVFFETVDKLLENHFRKAELSEEDLERIARADEEIPYLFERIMNIAYQQHEPVFSGWMDKGDPDSMEKFRERFINLSRDYAGRFVGSLFRKTPHADFAMRMPHNKGKSTLDLVLQTLGYNVKHDLPDIPEADWFQNEIEPDFYSQWGLNAINAEKCWSITQGEGVVAAVIDSGIDPYNSLFQDKTVPGFNFLQRTTPPWSDENPPMIDYGLHGTGVSSALLAVAPECRIMPIRTADAETMNDPPYDYWLWEWSAAGIYYAVNHGADIISKSARLCMAEPVIAEAVRYAYENNVIICTSAGNMPRSYLGLRPEEMLYPAFDREVLLIGGVEKEMDSIQPWPYSVPGPFVDVAAPSHDVFVAVPVYMEEFQNDYVAGTSLSAPIAAGVAALMYSASPPSQDLLEKPGAYVDLLSRCLKETARLKMLGTLHPNEFVGHGLIDAYAAVFKIKNEVE
jgi:subtilisin family serine protease